MGWSGGVGGQRNGALEGGRVVSPRPSTIFVALGQHGTMPGAWRVVLPTARIREAFAPVTLPRTVWL